MDQYRQQNGSLAGLFTTGLSDIVAATKAVAAASEAQALSVDPHAVDSMLKKLTEMQDALAKVQRQSVQLSNKTPLGGGYAEEIGAVNGQLGEQVVGEIIPEMSRAIDDLDIEQEKASPITIGKYDATQVAAPRGGQAGCEVFIPVTDSSTVEITANLKSSSTDTAAACERATKAAELIAPKLP
ncbi:DUF3558 family protein [Saccharothrix xinjiangensis]|uniref:DUF3558 family protein n=1 Tax=Saccharothrix xinjiangensis TaxID=204798 RepID=A0ABV9XYS6_9PSEU